MSIHTFCFAAGLTNGQSTAVQALDSALGFELGTNISRVHANLRNEHRIDHLSTIHSSSIPKFGLRLGNPRTIRADIPSHWGLGYHVFRERTKYVRVCESHWTLWRSPFLTEIIRGGSVEDEKADSLHEGDNNDKLAEPPLTIVVDKALICSVSDFFAAACKKDWNSGKTNTVISRKTTLNSSAYSSIGF